jgi:hypothetical protein
MRRVGVLVRMGNRTTPIDMERDKNIESLTRENENFSLTGGSKAWLCMFEPSEQTVRAARQPKVRVLS